MFNGEKPWKQVLRLKKWILKVVSSYRQIGEKPKSEKAENFMSLNGKGT